MLLKQCCLHLNQLLKELFSETIIETTMLTIMIAAAWRGVCLKKTSWIVELFILQVQAVHFRCQMNVYKVYLSVKLVFNIKSISMWNSFKSWLIFVLIQLEFFLKACSIRLDLRRISDNHYRIQQNQNRPISSFQNKVINTSMLYFPS